MLGKASKIRGRDEEGGLSQPLLNSSEEDLPSSSNGPSHHVRSNGNVLFSVDDGSDDSSEELLGEGNVGGDSEAGRYDRYVRKEHGGHREIFIACI